MCRAAQREEFHAGVRAQVQEELHHVGMQPWTIGESYFVTFDLDFQTFSKL